MPNARIRLALVLLAALPFLTGCITAENRLYGVWRQSGLAGLATGLELVFQRDGQLQMATNLGSQSLEWTVLSAAGNDYEIGLRSPGAETMVTRKLRFLDENQIETAVMDNLAQVRLTRIDPAAGNTTR
ncbi:hypothetical protein [Lignipirellula cremea]|uniref:Uncharacterized protein n=1 Tax=Lignipirellula cremea TaxID=2528010 RepID=A0A518DZ16_9BACT|nr:hypothetical protein [Lignipirellula cremea]QDU97089.1 hypothetical protein Pla8534_49150 [Lignipirellula cremea]